MLRKNATLPRSGSLLLVSAVAFAAVSAVALGCSSGKTAEEKQLDELRDEITKVQSTSDKFEGRLGKLEVDSADMQAPDEHSTDATRPPPTNTISAPVATPQLRVVHLGPDGLEESGAPGETAGATSDDPNDSAPRPRIRVQGMHAEATSFDSNDKDSKGKARPAALDPDARRSYDSALALVHAKKYPEALDALAGFLMKWPDHPNADNAMYWRGECYFAEGDFQHAAEQFEGDLARFPMGNKAPDATLKLGISKRHLGDEAAASAQFDKLRRDYPHSDAARHIPSAPAPSGAPSSGATGPADPQDAKVKP
jgi:tol-pal system protein YbgF